MEPEWLQYARKFLDLREIPGSEDNPVIVDWLIKLRAWWRDDDTPWCGVYVAHCFAAFGLAIPVHWYRAKGWLDWGRIVDFPAVGSVVVFERKGGGHVGFVVGRDADGHLMVLGGNQGNKVSIAPFDLERVLGYRWPPDKIFIATPTLPLLNSNGQLSSNEQ